MADTGLSMDWSWSESVVTVTTQDGYLSDNQVGSTPVNHSLFFVDQAKDNKRSSPRYEFMWRMLGL